MKEIIELNGRLRSELGQAVAKEGVQLRRAMTAGELSPLPLKWQAELEGLRGRLNAIIPDDILYTVYLGDEEAQLTLDYEDGPQVGTFGMGPTFSPLVSIFDQLQAMDWDEYRGEMISDCQVFGEMARKANESPSRLPSTKKLQKVFREEMKSFVKEKRKDEAKAHVLMFREEDGLNEECGLQEKTYNSLEEFSRDLHNIMMEQYWVVTVVAGGKPLPVKGIDALKRQALKELEDMPISHAKALGQL